MSQADVFTRPNDWANLTMDIEPSQNNAGQTYITP